MAESGTWRKEKKNFNIISLTVQYRNQHILDVSSVGRSNHIYKIEFVHNWIKASGGRRIRALGNTVISSMQNDCHIRGRLCGIPRCQFREAPTSGTNQDVPSHCTISCQFGLPPLQHIKGDSCLSRACMASTRKGCGARIGATPPSDFWLLTNGIMGICRARWL